MTEQNCNTDACMTESSYEEKYRRLYDRIVIRRKRKEADSGVEGIDRPLTLSTLMEMDGEPIYLPAYYCWAICEIYNDRPYASKRGFDIDLKRHPLTCLLVEPMPEAPEGSEETV